MKIQKIYKKQTNSKKKPASFFNILHKPKICHKKLTTRAKRIRSVTKCHIFPCQGKKKR
jgi:hypothetical protein